MNRTARILQLFAALAGLAGTPIVMYFAFHYLGFYAARQFRVLDVVSDYAEGIVVAPALLALIAVWPIPRSHRVPLMLLWLVRCGVTLGFMLPYEAYYGLDASGYYRFGLALNAPTEWLAYGAGIQNVTGIIALIGIATESYNAVKVIFSFFGMIAVYIFYRASIICLGTDNIAILYLLGLLPGIVFWSSIIGKDPIVLLGIAIYCYGVVGLIVQQKLSMMFYVLFGLLIATAIRTWLGVIFVAPLIMTYVLASRSSALTKIGFMLVAVPVFVATFQNFVEGFRLDNIEDLVETTDHISDSWAHGGSAQEIAGGFPSLESMISFAPVGMFAALFRPLPLEVPNAFGTVAGLENAFLLWLIVYGVLRRGLGWLRQPILLWAVVTLLVWGAVYGFASYQNLGTAFRFRLQVTPILFLLGLYLAFGNPLRLRKNLRKPAQHTTPHEEGDRRNQGRDASESERATDRRPR